MTHPFPYGKSLKLAVAAGGQSIAGDDREAKADDDVDDDNDVDDDEDICGCKL